MTSTGWASGGVSIVDCCTRMLAWLSIRREASVLESLDNVCFGGIMKIIPFLYLLLLDLIEVRKKMIEPHVEMLALE